MGDGRHHEAVAGALSSLVAVDAHLFSSHVMVF
jgi:hypothetical protein